MSNQQNTNWLESAYENFQSALADKDIGTAKAIIADALDFGFYKEAQVMNLELRNV